MPVKRSTVSLSSPLTRSPSTSTPRTSTPKPADASRPRAPGQSPFVAKDELADLTKQFTTALRASRPDQTGTPKDFKAFLKDKGLRLDAKDEGQVKMLLASHNRPAQYLQGVKERRQDAVDARRKPVIDATAAQNPTPAQTANPNAVKEISDAEIALLPNRALQDFARLGYGNAAQFLAMSPTAVSRLDETSNAGVRVAEGFSNGRSMTSRPLGSSQTTVYMNPTLKSGAHQEAAGTFLFEMNNAHRWDRFEALNADAKKKVGTAPEYAQKKMEIEVEGMLHTGKAGKELVQGKHAALGDLKGWYVTDYLAYSKRAGELPQDLSPADKKAALGALRSDIARERLDVPHGTTSHRQVYETQFNTAR